MVEIRGKSHVFIDFVCHIQKKEESADYHKMKCTTMTDWRNSSAMKKGYKNKLIRKMKQVKRHGNFTDNEIIKLR